MIFKSHFSDPKPWVEGGDLKTALRFSNPDETPFKTSYYPRPEFDALQVNRILQDFREDYRWVMNWVPFMDEWVADLSDPEEAARIFKSRFNPHSDAEIEHARKVITRLRKLRA